MFNIKIPKTTKYKYHKKKQEMMYVTLWMEILNPFV